MATATAREAKAIEQQLEHSADQVRLAEQALRASVQPWLTWETTYEVVADSGPVGFAHGGLRVPGTHSGAEVCKETGKLVGFVPVRNVGNGLAIIDLSESWVLACVPRAPGQVQRRGHPATDAPVVPPGGVVEISFAIDLRAADGTTLTFDELIGRPSTPGQFAVEICYRDAVHGSPTRAIFSLESSWGNDWWGISRIEYHSEDRPESDVTVVLRQPPSA